MGIIRSSKYQALFSSGPKATNCKGKQKNQKTKFDAPKSKEKPQQLDDPSSSRKNKHKGKEGKEKLKCSYCEKGFHLESSCMKKQLDDTTLLLEKNNINLPKGTRKRKNHDRNVQPKRGHALMENVSDPRALLIDSCSSNHMVASKEFFSSLYFDNNIPIHKGDYSQIQQREKVL